MKLIDILRDKNFYHELIGNQDLSQIDFEKQQYQNKYNFEKDAFEKTPVNYVHESVGRIKAFITTDKFRNSEILLKNKILNPKLKNVLLKYTLIKHAIIDDYFLFVLYRKKYYIIIFSARKMMRPIRVFKVPFDENGNDIRYQKRKTVKDLGSKNTKEFVNCNAGLKRSCQIWAFAKILNLTFEQAHDILSKQGWTENDTRLMEIRWQNALQKLGKEFKLIWKYNYLDKSSKKFALINVIKKLNSFTNAKNRSFAIMVRGHVLCVIDNVIYDNIKTPPYTRVEKIYEIV